MIDLDSDLVSGLPAEEVLLRARHARLIFGKATRALFFWLKEVENRRLFSKWGYSSLFAFAESELELDPRTISEMLRTHRCLKELPGLQALAEEIAPSKLREISRVCTPLTESFWIEQARAKSCRVIEKLVSITPKGGLPPVALGEERRDKEPSIAGNVPEPTSEIAPVKLRYKFIAELEGDAWEILEEALRAAGRECGTRDRGVVLRHLAETFLLRSQDGEVSSGVAQAPYRVVIHESPVHGVAWVEGRNGVRFVEAEQVEEAHCCGEILDLRDPVSVSGDGASLGTASSKKHAGSTPKGPRLRSAVPPSVRRMVFERDGGRCTMPSCTNRAWNHEHHIHPRSKPGSTNDPSNLTLVCSSCHRALHRRRLFVEGQAPGLLVWKNAKGQVVRGSSGASDGKASAVPAV